MSLQVEELRHPTPEDLERLNSLLPQLSSSAPPLDAESISHVIRQPGTTMFVARLNGALVGTLTLVIFPIPTGLRAWIEDVVVDQTARRLGIGKALTEEAIKAAESLGVRTVDLTSRPSRRAAVSLYEQLGFKARQTNVYRLDQFG